MKSANELMNEIGAWADKMFPVHLPDLGLIEEIGEATHGVLKRAQKIRKMDDDEFFIPHMKDAFSDIMIYLLHLCYRHNVPLSFNAANAPFTAFPVNPTTERQYISTAMKTAAVLLDYCELGDSSPSNLFVVPCQRLCNTIIQWGKLHNIDVREETEKTWNETVSKRDWSKNRDSAHADVPQG